MRITPEQQAFFTHKIPQVLPEAQVFLFGSRTDDNKRGGDIDILVLGTRRLTLDEKLDIKRGFYDQFGEQKLDLVSFDRNEQSTFKSLVIDEALTLH